MKPEMEETVLEARELSKDYSGIIAVDNLSTSFQRDTLTAIIGPNGAGKTTFFNLISGLVKPSSGQIRFNGEDITDLSPDEIARRGLVRSFQVVNLFPNLTAKENAHVGVQSKSAVSSLNFWTDSNAYPEITERTERILDTVGLSGKHDTIASDLSYGQQRMLEIALVLAMDPDLVLLDEPTSGLSARSTTAIVDVIEEISRGRTTIVIEHDMHVVEQIADVVKVLHQGQIFFEGQPDEVRNNAEVQRIYLGEQ